MGNSNKKKFVILANGRSGSTMLVHLLDSHPEIKCEGELLSPDWGYIKRNYVLMISKMWPRFIADYRRWRCRESVYGFKLLPNALVFQRPALLTFSRRGWKIVHLIRNNLFHQALSLAVAEQTGIYHRPEHQVPTQLRVDPEEILYNMVLSDRMHVWHQNVLADINCLTLSYEDDLEEISNRMKTSKMLCDYLGVVNRRLTTDVPRTHHRPYSEMIENYNQIVTFIGTTRYGSYLP